VPKQNYVRRALLLAAMLACWLCSPDAQSQTQSGAESQIKAVEEPKLTLTPAQRDAIYKIVGNDKSKIEKSRFTPTVGSDVPPMIVLYPLPAEAIAGNPAAGQFQYTVVQDQVVLVDPTKMRVVDVIGPSPPR
jgi:hypothetical protein